MSFDITVIDAYLVFTQYLGDLSRGLGSVSIRMLQYSWATTFNIVGLSAYLEVPFSTMCLSLGSSLASNRNVRPPPAAAAAAAPTMVIAGFPNRPDALNPLLLLEKCPCLLPQGNRHEPAHGAAAHCLENR